MKGEPYLISVGGRGKAYSILDRQDGGKHFHFQVKKGRGNHGYF